MDNFGFFTIKDNEWLENQRHAGKVLANALSLVEENIKEGISTLYINNLCEEFILSNEGCIPTFKGYIGFPAASCISVNEEVVHGIPKEDKILKVGDIVKIDCGVTYKGAIADSAICVVVEEYLNFRDKDLVECCVNCLSSVIKLIERKIGIIRVGDVGYFIKKEAAKIGANSIKELTGHGLELNKPHWYPQIFNVGDRNNGIVLVPNMTICIEPIFVYGSLDIFVKEDKFTIAANSIGVHCEHTIFIHEDKVETITKRINEKT